MFTGSRRCRPGYVVVPRGGREGQSGKQRGRQRKKEETERGIAPRLLNDFWLLGEQRATGRERETINSERTR